MCYIIYINKIPRKLVLEYLRPKIICLLLKAWLFFFFCKIFPLDFSGSPCSKGIPLQGKMDLTLNILAQDHVEIRHYVFLFINGDVLFDNIWRLPVPLYPHHCSAWHVHPQASTPSSSDANCATCHPAIFPTLIHQATQIFSPNPPLLALLSRWSLVIWSGEMTELPFRPISWGR